MKRQILLVTAALMMFSQGAALPQSAYAVIDLSPNQRAYIKDYVLRERVRPAILEERVSMGDTVDSNIELRQVPAHWGPALQGLSYFISDDRVHLVDPRSRRVVLDIL